MHWEGLVCLNVVKQGYEVLKKCQKERRAYMPFLVWPTLLLR